MKKILLLTLLILVGCSKELDLNEVYEGDWIGTLKPVTGMTRKELAEYEIFTEQNIQLEIDKREEKGASLSAQQSVVQLLNIADFLGYENVTSQYFTKDDYIPTTEEIILHQDQSYIDKLDEEYIELVKSGETMAAFVKSETIAEKLINCGGKCTSKNMTMEEAKNINSFDMFSYIMGEANNIITNQKENSFELEILSNESAYNYTTVNMSIKNTTSSRQNFIKVKVSLLDSSGNVIDTETTYATGAQYLDVGDTKKFSVMFNYDERATDVTASVVYE
ncbi:FxLYD domain-containing protein [Turicibacter sanguinis]|uniref:FxLYD domain-containing protein n=1 Tax=Turicibacter sanguinis TaxID=154288 RepID=UPI00189F7E0C|nr:FxLYD domain-containing protein [Turicibacter sanguinis]